MRVTTHQILWHDKQPLLSCDTEPHGNRLATAGGDNDVKIWKYSIVEETDANSAYKHKVKIEYAASLTRHQKCVNVVRFSPNGTLLASAGDDGFVIVWYLNESVSPPADAIETECWQVHSILQQSQVGVYDLAWSADGSHIATGSIDNAINVWRLRTGKQVATIQDHTHYVQGVAWDPRNSLLASLSNDRSARVYEVPPEYVQGARKRGAFSLRNAVSHAPPAADGGTKRRRLVLGEQEGISYFRRLCFSTDGELLVVPSCVMLPELNGAAAAAAKNDEDGAKTVTPGTYVYQRAKTHMPYMALPCADGPTVCARFARSLFEKRRGEQKLAAADTETETSGEADYTMRFAVCTQSSVYVYDTQYLHPIVRLADQHYAPIHDCAFSDDARLLFFVSADGYCTSVLFDDTEVSALLPADKLPKAMRDVLALRAADNTEDADAKEKDDGEEEAADAEQKATASSSASTATRRVAPVPVQSVSNATSTSTSSMAASAVAPRRVTPLNALSNASTSTSTTTLASTTAVRVQSDENASNGVSNACEEAKEPAVKRICPNETEVVESHASGAPAEPIEID